MTNAFKVRYLNVGNCFLYLNESSLKKFGSNFTKIVELKHGKEFGKVEYFTFYGQPSVERLGDDEVGISSKYAQSLGITNQCHVVVSACSYNVVSSVYVRPISEEDNVIIVSVVHTSK